MPVRKGPYTEGARAQFDPDAFFELWDPTKFDLNQENNDLRSAIIKIFNLPPNDSHVYHAPPAAVTLAQVQATINAGSKNGLLAWYRDEEGKELPGPPLADISAYTSIFQPSTLTPKSLTSFQSNAKKDSLRQNTAEYLSSQLHLPTAPLTLPKPPKKAATAPKNPYLDLWTWLTPHLAWCGPSPSTASTRHSHATLPVLYHHFGCAVPSTDALHLLRQLVTQPNITGVLDLGSGNGYWTYMLRRQDIPCTAIDNGDAVWRTLWISDTVRADAAEYLRKNGGAADKVALMVYPVVSGEWMRGVLKQFKGEWVVVVGTQCRNGFTGFKDITVREWTEGSDEEGKKWEITAQVPMPSFAGKDEAVFVLKRKTT